MPDTIRRAGPARVNLDPAIATGQVTIIGAAAVPGRPGHRHRRLPGGQPARRRIDRLGFAQRVPRFTVRIVASVANFPTVFGPNRALIADLPAVNDLLDADQVTLGPPGDAPAGDPLVAAHR
jgi:hypothetical protein